MSGRIGEISLPITTIRNQSDGAHKEMKDELINLLVLSDSKKSKSMRVIKSLVSLPSSIPPYIVVPSGISGSSWSFEHRCGLRLNVEGPPDMVVLVVVTSDWSLCVISDC